MELNSSEGFVQIIDSDRIQKKPNFQSVYAKTSEKPALSFEDKRLNKIRSKLQILNQQIEFYTKEYESALENAKNCSCKLTKEMCIELCSYERLSKTVYEICAKTMLVLEQQGQGFKAFKSLCAKFEHFKELMSLAQESNLSESIISEILPIWKNQTMIQAKVSKTSKAAALLAQWLGFMVEYNLKRGTVNTSKRRVPELEKKLKIQMELVENLKNDNYIARKVCLNKENSCEDKHLENFSEGIENYRETQNQPFGSSIHPVAASAAYLYSSMSSERVGRIFPNFDDEGIYAEERIKESDGQSLIYEDIGEIPGCLRNKFFCF
jgi:hypothetical protein